MTHMDLGDLRLEPAADAGDRRPAAAPEGASPPLTRAHLAAARARLRAEHVRLWKRRHIEMFDQLRAQATAAPSAEAATEPRAARPTASAASAEPQRDADGWSVPIRHQWAWAEPQPACPVDAGADRGWVPAPRRARERPRPSFHRTKLAAVENEIFRLEPPMPLARPSSANASVWAGLLRWIDGVAAARERPSLLARGRPASTGEPSPPVAAGEAAPRLIGAPGRHGRARPEDDGVGAASAHHLDGLAVLQTYFSRMQARVRSAAQPDGWSPSAALPALADRPPAEGPADARRAHMDQGAPPRRRMSDPTTTGALFTMIFLVIATPFLLMQAGAFSPASVTSAVARWTDGLGFEITGVGEAATTLENAVEARSVSRTRSGRAGAEATLAGAVIRRADGSTDPPEQGSGEAAGRSAGPAAPAGYPPAEPSPGEIWSELYRLGQDLVRAGRLEDAAATLAGAAELKPDHPAIQFDLGHLRQRLGDTRGAIAAYRASLALQPRYPRALYNLGLLLHQAGRLDEAMPLYESALHLLPDNPYVAFNLATLLERRGEVGRARLMFERAIATGSSRRIGDTARSRLASLRG